MSKEELIRRAMKAIEEQRKLPPGVGFRRMVDAGIIDAEGHVLWDGPGTIAHEKRPPAEPAAE